MESYTAQLIFSRKGWGSATFIPKLETATAGADDKFAIDPEISFISTKYTFSHSISIISVLR